MPTSTGFNHVATVTADLDRVVAFAESSSTRRSPSRWPPPRTTRAWRSSTSAVAAPST